MPGANAWKEHHNMLTAKPATFVAAMKHFFGLLEGQTLSSFATELKALSPADRELFKQGLKDNGYPIAD